MKAGWVRVAAGDGSAIASMVGIAADGMSINAATMATP
jgi:hypothetical protein